jgi:DNA-binding NarL/FixJ family response regulator
MTTSEAASSLRVLVADDHTMLREGLRRSLVNNGFDVVAEAADGAIAVDLVLQLRPDVVLMDVTMPVLDGISAARRITQQLPDAHIVMLTMHAEPRLMAEAAAAGALGYLVKDCTTADIVEAVRRAGRGERTLEVPATPPAPPPSTDNRSIITQRETEVLQMIANGKSTTEAAKALFVSVKTVKNHLASVYGKLDAHDRTQAVLRAARLGLITIENDEGPRS